MKFAFSLVLVGALVISSAESVNALTIHIPGDHETIQAGIDAAQNGDTVLVEPGVYVENIDFNNKGIVVASLFLTSGDENYIDVTVIDGDSSGSVVRIDSGAMQQAILMGFTIRNGFADFGGGVVCYGYSSISYLHVTENSASDAGGGIAGIAHMDHLRVTRNNAREMGGGIYLFSAQTSLENVEVSENSTEGHGGGIYCSWYSIMDSVSLISNQAVDGDGGGMYCRSSNVDMTNLTVTGNSAARGGGFYFYRSSPNLTTGVIGANRSENDGGGIYFDTNEDQESPAILTDLTISHNNALDGAGGIEVINANVIFNEISIIGNTAATFAGGVSCTDCSPTFTAILVANNRAGRNGGGIQLVNSSPVLNHATIVGNVSESGWGGGLGVFADSHPTICNSIFWDNDAPEILMQQANHPMSLDIAYTDIRGGRREVETYGNVEIDWGEGIITDDPLFVDPDNEDFNLDFDSPCIDTGDPESDPDRDGTRADMGVFSFHQRDIEVEPDAVEFVYVQAGMVDSMAVVVRNDGRTPLSVSRISIIPEESPFALSGGDNGFELEPEAYAQFVIRFSPDEELLYQAVLRIESNDPDEGQLDVPVTGNAMDIESPEEIKPRGFAIQSVYPNPFNSSTTISYSLTRASTAKISLLDISGRVLYEVSHGIRDAGLHEVVISSPGLPAGIYIVILEANGGVKPVKLVCIK